MFAQPSNDLAGNKRERPLRGEFKLKLHGGKNVQISSEAHKKIKKSEVTEKNKHASIREMEKFVKRTLQSLARGRGGGDDGQWPRGQAAGLRAAPMRGLEEGNWPRLHLSSLGMRAPR